MPPSTPPSCPPGTPPGTPPTTPLSAASGGGASSFTCAICLGITLGANSLPCVKNDFGTRGALWTAAGGGGGGGGGGGATSIVFCNCLVLIASVKYSGNRISKATTKLCPSTETRKSQKVRG